MPSSATILWPVPKRLLKPRPEMTKSARVGSAVTACCRLLTWPGRPTGRLLHHRPRIGQQVRRQRHHMLDQLTEILARGRIDVDAEFGRIGEEGRIAHGLHIGL